MKDLFVIVAGLLVTGINCQNLSRTHQIYFENNVPKPIGRKVIRPDQETHNNINSFSWRLFQGAKSPNPVDNLILSPLSLQFLLALLEIGAAGETKRQLQYVTGYNQMEAMSQIMRSSTSRESSTLKTGAAVFVDASKRLNDTFIRIATSAGADMFSVDFARLPQSARHTVNTWATKVTNGRINSLIGPTTDVSGMSVMLCSAIFFQGSWKYKFQPAEPEVFFTYLGKGSTKTQFMEIKQNFVIDSIDLGGKVEGNFVEIPYQGDANSMLIIVPNEGVTLDSFIRRMDENTFENLIKRLPGIPVSFIKLRIPRFKVGSYFSVVNSLLKMGLVDPFTSTARFPYVTNDGQIKITDIIQQAEIDVNEEGTVATAAAAVYAVPLSAASAKEFVFTVNKPFISIIVDKRNQVPLFISKIYQPYV